jgi:hypothetical protein
VELTSNDHGPADAGPPDDGVGPIPDALVDDLCGRSLCPDRAQYGGGVATAACESFLWAVA